MNLALFFLRQVVRRGVVGTRPKVEVADEVVRRIGRIPCADGEIDGRRRRGRLARRRPRERVRAVRHRRVDVAPDARRGKRLPVR